MDWTGNDARHKPQEGAKMRLRALTSLLTIGALICSGIVSGTIPAYAEETPTAAPVSAAVSLSSDPKIKAWQDLRFGLFIHWGVYSEYAGYVGDKRQEIGYPEQIKAWEKISDADYLATASKMTIPEFNPQKWCQDAKDAGMKYLLVTSKHHDGFTMFRSDTTTFDFSDAAPGGRDPMKELADACRAIDMKLGFYFSIIDWTKQVPEPYRNVNPLDAEMMDLIKAQLQELLSGRYGEIPELWFDMGGPTPEQSQQMAQWVREFSPNTMVNSRVWNDKGDFEVGGDNALVSRMTLNPWESIRSVFPKCWGYCRWDEVQAVRESADGVANQTHHEVENLFTTVANGGQYLLNVGPKGSGAFDAFDSKILEGIGAWNNRHPNVIHGAVPTYYPVETWGHSVINGDAIYLGIKKWENGAEIRLQGAGSNVTAVEVDSADSSGQALNYRVDEATKDLYITLPEAVTDPVLPVIKVTTNGAPVYVPAAAVSVEEGALKSTGTNGITRIESPKSSAGTAQNIAYVRNDKDEEVKLVVSGEGGYAHNLPISITVGDQVVTTTGSALNDGVKGFTLPAKTTARVIVEKGDKTYYAEGFGGFRRDVSALMFGIEDETKSPIIIRHEFVSTSETPLPEEVTALLPGDRQALAGIPKVVPSAPAQAIVNVNDLRWTFKGWDARSKATEGVDTVVFTGRWQPGSLTYPVSFSYVSGSPDHPFPDALAYQALRSREYNKGESVTFEPPRTPTFRDNANGKTWRFARWEPASVESISAPLEVRGVWEYQRDQDVTSEYSFVAADGSALPAEVMAQLPAPEQHAAPVARIVPTRPAEETVPVEGGEWIFTRYDRSMVRWPAGPTETFVGTWRFQKTRHTVTFRYVSADESQPLPQSVQELLPQPVKIEEGSDATFERPTPAAVAVDNGVWTFDSWDTPTLTNVSAPAEVVGTWSFQAGEVSHATHKYISGTEGEDLPVLLSYFAPAPEPYLIGGTAYPATVKDKISYMGAAPWKFTGWTPEKVENAQADVEFVGTWVKLPSSYTVTYTFATANGDLPAEVQALLPEEVQLGFRAEHKAVDLEKTQVPTIEGTWIFEGWDKQLVTVEDNLTITGTWTFSQRVYEPQYKVDNLPDVVVQAHDVTAPFVFRDGKVCAPEPVGTQFRVNGVIWTFMGYKKDCYSLDEIEQFATVTGGSVSGSVGGAFFAMADNLMVVYKLPFTPIWQKKVVPGSGNVGGTNGGSSNGTSTGSTGTGSTGSTSSGSASTSGAERELNTGAADEKNGESSTATSTVAPGKGGMVTTKVMPTRSGSNLAQTGADHLLPLLLTSMAAAICGVVVMRRRA